MPGEQRRYQGLWSRMMTGLSDGEGELPNSVLSNQDQELFVLDEGSGFFH